MIIIIIITLQIVTANNVFYAVEDKEDGGTFTLFSKKGELEENAALSAMHEKYYQKIKPTKKIRFNIGDYVWIARLKLMFGRGHD